MLWTKLAIKEILNNKKFSIFFIVNLALGLVGFIALNSFSSSLLDHFHKNLKNILTADLAIFSRQALSHQEIEDISLILGPDHKESLSISFYSMISANSKARLSQIVAVDENFPLYGHIVLRKLGTVTPSVTHRELLIKPSVWFPNDVLVSLALTTGESVKIGNLKFLIPDVIEDEPRSVITGFTLAPRIYIGINKVEQTGLIRTGSRVNYVRYYRFPEETDIESIALILKERFNNSESNGKDIRIRSFSEASQRLGQVIGYFTGYLGLIAIVALFLAGIGTVYLFKSYLNERFQSMAILMSLGANRKETYEIVLIQIVVLGFCSALLAILLTFFILPLVPGFIRGVLPTNIEVGLDAKGILLALCFGTLGSLVFCLPVLTKIHNLKPLALIQERVIASKKNIYEYFLITISFVPSILVFWLLAIWQTHSLEDGSIFFLLYGASLLLLGAVGWGIIWLAEKLTSRAILVVKIALRNLYRNKSAAVSCFLAISMGAFLMNIIPQIQNGLRQEIQSPTGLKVPAFFLFDIQPEQLDPLNDLLSSKQLRLSSVSPMIRARLEKLNGVLLAKKINNTKDADRKDDIQHLQTHGFNLSYRVRLQNSEKITEGRELSNTFDTEAHKPADLSVEIRFAQRYGLEIGDILLFNIQGVAVEGKIVNFRSVRWNSFQPNFFVLFQPGVLEDAPQTFLASISQIEPALKLPLQVEMARKFPNISIVDVSKIISRILDIGSQLVWAINFMAVLSILAGLAVVYSISRYEAHNRSWEINLLKVVGASFKDIRTIVQIEFGVLGFLATLSGILLSIAVSFVISQLFFDSIWTFSWIISLACLVLVSLISIMTALAATSRILKQKPLALLRSA